MAPHQTEVLFVLTQLMSGRRKVDVTRRLAEAGLVTKDVLGSAFRRCSWGVPRTHPRPQHVHGPNCSCDPDTAIRVQVCGCLMSTLRALISFSSDFDFVCVTG